MAKGEKNKKKKKKFKDKIFPARLLNNSVLLAKKNE